jgi:hypothetical protein
MLESACKAACFMFLALNFLPVVRCVLQTRSPQWSVWKNCQLSIVNEIK